MQIVVMECVQKFSLCKSKFWFIFFVSCWFNKTLLHSITFPMSISIFRGNCCLYNWFLHVVLVWLPMLQRHTPTSRPNPNGGNCLQPQATGGLRGLTNIHLRQWRCAEFAVTVGETCVPCGSHLILAGAYTILIKNQQQCWTLFFLLLEHTAFRDCSSGVDSWHLHKTKFSLVLQFPQIF